MGYGNFRGISGYFRIGSFHGVFRVLLGGSWNFQEVSHRDFGAFKMDYGDFNGGYGGFRGLSKHFRCVSSNLRGV